MLTLTSSVIHRIFYDDKSWWR